MLKLRFFYCLYNVSSTSRRCSNQQYMEAHFASLIITDETEKHHVQQLLYMPIYREMYIAFDLFNLTCCRMKRILFSSWFFDCTVSYRLSLNFIGKICKITQITLYCVRSMVYLPRWNLFLKKKVYLYKKKVAYAAVLDTQWNS